MKRPIEFFRCCLFVRLAGDQIADLRQFEMVVQMDQVGFYVTRLQHVNTGEQHAIGIKDRFGSFLLLLFKKLSLRRIKTPVVMVVMSRDAAQDQQSDSRSGVWLRSSYRN